MADDDNYEPLAPTNDNPSINSGSETYPSRPNAISAESFPSLPSEAGDITPDTSGGIPARNRQSEQSKEKEIPRGESLSGGMNSGESALEGLSPGGHAPTGIDPSNPNLDDATRQRLQDFAEHKGAMDDAEFGKAYARSQGPTPSHRVLDTIANQVGPDQREAAIKAALKRADEANGIGREAWNQQHMPRAAAWLTAANASTPNGWNIVYTATPDGKMVVEANHVANQDPNDPNGHKTWAIPNDRFSEIIHDPQHFSPHALMSNQKAVFDMFDKAEGNPNVQAPRNDVGPTREQLLGQPPASVPGQDTNVPAPETPQQAAATRAKEADVGASRAAPAQRPTAQQPQQPRGSMENYQARNYMAHALNQQRLAEEGRLPNGLEDPMGRARAQIALDKKYSALRDQMERQYPVPTSQQTQQPQGQQDEFGGLQPPLSKDMTEHDKANYLRQHPTGDYVKDLQGNTVPPNSAGAREAAWERGAHPIQMKGKETTPYMGAHLNANKQWSVIDADGREHTFADRKSAQAAESDLGPTAREAIAIHNKNYPTEDLGQPQRAPREQGIPESTGRAQYDPYYQSGINVIRAGTTTHYDQHGGSMVPTAVWGTRGAMPFSKVVGGGRGADQTSLENLKHQHRMEQINAQGGRASHGEAAKIQGQNAMERAYMQAHPDEYVHDSSGVHWKDPNAGKGGQTPQAQFTDGRGNIYVRGPDGRPQLIRRGGQ